jgi:serine/threonine-protein kinase
MLAEVQVVRDDLGAANVETALLRQVQARRSADPTTMIPAMTSAYPVTPDRPNWARLPEQSPRAYGSPRPAPGAGGLKDRLTALFAGGDRRRTVILAAVVAMVLVVVGTAWWVTSGRYTDSPQLLNLPKAAAETTADQGGFQIVYNDGGYSETVAKDTVLAEDPAPGARIVRGGVITVTLSLGPERYPVPDVTGMELSAAQAALDEVKLKLKQGTKRYSDTAPEGVVISTSPKAKTVLKPGDTVTVVISKGRAPITVPDLTGANINDARAQLQQLGLDAVEEYKDSDQPADTVIGQSPKPGTGASKEDDVKLEVSKGPAQVTMPNVVGQDCTQAQQQLQQLGLQVQVGLLQQGQVRQQNPGENTVLPPNSQVQIQCF